MDLKALAEYLVKRIVTNIDAVSVEEKKVEDTYMINITVSEEDIGRVIGKDGKMINAIRTIVQASGYINEKPNVKVNIDTKN